MLFVIAKLNFQQLLLQSSWSHDPSEIIVICWFGAQETFVIIMNVEKQLLLIFFVETMIYFFRIVWWSESSKEQHLFDIEMFCNF